MLLAFVDFECLSQTSQGLATKEKQTMMQSFVEAVFQAMQAQSLQDSTSTVKSVKKDDSRVAVTTPLGSLVVFGGWSNSDAKGVWPMLCSFQGVVGVLGFPKGSPKISVAKPLLQVEKAVLAPAEAVRNMLSNYVYLALLDKNGNVWTLVKGRNELEQVARQAQDVCLTGGSFIAVLAKRHVLLVDTQGVAPCLITEVGGVSSICANSVDQRVYCTNKSVVSILDYQTDCSTSTDLGFMVACATCSRTRVVVLGDMQNVTILDQDNLAVLARAALPDLARVSFYLSSVGDVLACQTNDSYQATSVVFTRQETDQLELDRQDSPHKSDQSVV